MSRCSSRIHRLNKSLFKNAPLLTFLSADLFPFKHARMFLTKLPNSFPGRSVKVNLERILMFHMRFQVNNILKFQDFKQVPREEYTTVPVQKSNTVVNQQCSTVQRTVPEQKCNDVQTDVFVTVP